MLDGARIEAATIKNRAEADREAAQRLTASDYSRLSEVVWASGDRERGTLLAAEALRRTTESDPRRPWYATRLMQLSLQFPGKLFATYPGLDSALLDPFHDRLYGIRGVEEFLWDLPAGRPVWTRSIEPQSRFLMAAFSPTGKRLGGVLRLGFLDSVVRFEMINLRSGRRLQGLSPNAAGSEAAEKRGSGADLVDKIAFTGDGAATVEFGYLTAIVNGIDPGVVQHLVIRNDQRDPAAVLDRRMFSFQPGRDWMLGVQGGLVTVLDLHTGAPVPSLGTPINPDGKLQSAQISANGRWIVFAMAENGRVKVAFRDLSNSRSVVCLAPRLLSYQLSELGTKSEIAHSDFATIQDISPTGNAALVQITTQPSDRGADQTRYTFEAIFDTKRGLLIPLPTLIPQPSLRSDFFIQLHGGHFSLDGQLLWLLNRNGADPWVLEGFSVANGHPIGRTVDLLAHIKDAQWSADSLRMSLADGRVAGIDLKGVHGSRTISLEGTSRQPRIGVLGADALHVLVVSDSDFDTGAVETDLYALDNPVRPVCRVKTAWGHPADVGQPDFAGQVSRERFVVGLIGPERTSLAIIDTFSCRSFKITSLSTKGVLEQVGSDGIKQVVGLLANVKGNSSEFSVFAFDLEGHLTARPRRVQDISRASLTADGNDLVAIRGNDLVWFRSGDLLAGTTTPVLAIHGAEGHEVELEWLLELIHGGSLESTSTGFTCVFPSGLRTVVTSEGGSIHIRNRETAENIVFPASRPQRPAFSPNLRYVAVVEIDSEYHEHVRVFDLVDGAALPIDVAITSGVKALTFSADSSVILTLWENGDMRSDFLGRNFDTVPDWLVDVAEVATGRRLTPSSTAAIPGSDYRQLRMSFIKHLQQAARGGDENFRQMLAHFNTGW